MNNIRADIKKNIDISSDTLNTDLGSFKTDRSSISQPNINVLQPPENTAKSLLDGFDDPVWNDTSISLHDYQIRDAILPEIHSDNEIKRCYSSKFDREVWSWQY